MNVLLDVDDVLLEWRVGFENWLVKTRPITYKKIIEEYETVERALIQGNKELMKTAADFNEELEFSQLNPLSDAVDYVRRLYENGFKLYCITSCGTKKITIKLRKYNLIRHFGDIFEDIYHVDIGSSKSRVLSRFKKSFWVEDNIPNSLVGESLGHIPILLNKSYNIDSKGDVIRTDNWKEIYTVITELTN